MKIKNKVTKVTAFLAVAVLAVSFTACGKESTPSVEDYSKMFDTQESEYGAVMKNDSTSFAVPMSYDSNFLDKDAVTVIANYFYAVQTKDTKLYRESTYGFYEDYLINNVYKDAGYTEKTFVEALNNGMANASGKNFKISNIEISAYDDKDVDVSSIKQAVTDIGKGKLDEKDIQDIVKLTLNFYLDADGTTYTQNNETVYIIKSDDKWHLITS